jgi:hypothetical protein
VLTSKKVDCSVPIADCGPGVWPNGMAQETKRSALSVASFGVSETVQRETMRHLVRHLGETISSVTSRLSSNVVHSVDESSRVMSCARNHEPRGVERLLRRVMKRRNRPIGLPKLSQLFSRACDG